MSRPRILLAWAALLTCLAWPALGRAAPADEAAVRQTIDALVAAVNAHDAAALAGLWTADGDVVDVAGHLATAKERIAARAGTEGDKPAEPGTLEAHVETIRFVTADIALVDGWGTSQPAEGGPARPTRFTAVLKKQQGRWLLDALREGAMVRAPAPIDLSELAWLLGTWEGSNDETSYRVVARYSDDHHFILRDFTVTLGDRVAFAGHQRIGWDPRSGAFKSWTFDSDGGVGEGRWSKVGKSWMVEASSIRPDGGETSAVNTYTPVAADRVLWQSIGGLADQMQLPDLAVELVRTGGAP